MSVGLAAPRLEPVVAPPLASLALGRSVGGVAAKERSFWSSLPGLFTGLAGVLTGVVALLGLALNQGWIGDGSAQEDAPSGGEEVVRISVEPESLELSEVPTQSAKSVTVTNEGTGPVTLSTEIEEDDADEDDPPSFSADDDCGGELPPGRSCKVTVRLSAGTGRYSATLVVSADGEQSQEVSLTGTAAL